MSRRILLADDSVTIQKVIELTFMDDDYEVKAVGNGDDALALLAASPFDFVIADVHMPGANGYEVCRKAKAMLPKLPVLLLVGTFEPFDEAQARSCGADSHLKKPFDSQELLQRVHELLGPDPAAAPAATPAPSPLAAAPAADKSADWHGFELEAEPEEELPAAAHHDALDVRPFTLDEPLIQEPSVEETAPMPVPAPPPVVPPPPVAVVAPPPAAAMAAASTGNGGAGQLAAADVDRIARRVVELMGDKVIRDIAWEVIPDLAEVVIKDRLRELESQVE